MQSNQRLLDCAFVRSISFVKKKKNPKNVNCQ